MNSEEMKQDQYIKKLFDEAGMEQPSGKFTSNIINTIKAESKESTFEYKPVISRTAWRIIAALGIGLFAYLLFGASGEGQAMDIYGYSLNIDTTKIKSLFGKVALSFELTPIMKTAFIALVLFTFSNLLIFELKNKSFFK